MKHALRQSDAHIAEAWRGQNLSLYLDRCQVDTPPDLVELTWREVRRRRPTIGKVVDFGAGDGRHSILPDSGSINLAVKAVSALRRKTAQSGAAASYRRSLPGHFLVSSTRP